MNYWLVQANPTKYRIIEYYAKCGNPGTPNTWHSAFAGKVRANDKVFCLKSKGNDSWRGILSLEEVTCNATKGLKPFPHEEGYWIDEKQRERLLAKWGFTTRTVKAFPYNPIREDDFKKYHELGDLKVPKTFREGVLRGILPLSEIQGQSLEDLIKRTRCAQV